MTSGVCDADVVLGRVGAVIGSAPSAAAAFGAWAVRPPGAVIAPGALGAVGFPHRRHRLRPRGLVRRTEVRLRPEFADDWDFHSGFWIADECDVLSIPWNPYLCRQRHPAIRIVTSGWISVLSTSQVRAGIVTVLDADAAVLVVACSYLRVGAVVGGGILDPEFNEVGVVLERTRDDVAVATAAGWPPHGCIPGTGETSGALAFRTPRCAVAAVAVWRGVTAGNRCGGFGCGR